MDWAELNYIQYAPEYPADRRTEARKLLDAERLRCYNYDREHGTNLLYQFTMVYMEGFEMPDVEIDNGVAPPAETEPVKKGRGRPKGTAKPSQASKLVDALTFIDICKNETYEFSSYVSLSNNMAVAYNNVLSAGHPIEEELQLCPQLDKLKAALNKCGKSLTITETEKQISIKGEKLHAYVPCLETALAPIRPDDCVYTGDFDKLKDAFRICGTLASETGDRPVEASLLLDPNTCSGTNGKALLQYWHGIVNMPPGTVVPKTFAAAVAATKYKIVGIGASWNGTFATSLTLWFEGGAWIKTQCYEDRWPSLDHILGVPGENTLPVPADMFEAIKAVEPFASEELGAVYFIEDAVTTHVNGQTGATYKVKGLPAGKIFNPTLVKQVAPFVKTIDLVSLPDKALFFGGTEANPIRGALMGMSGSK